MDDSGRGDFLADERRGKDPGPEMRAIQIRNLRITLRAAHASPDKVT
jgi:hypothetical protein